MKGWVLGKWCWWLLVDREGLWRKVLVAMAWRMVVWRMGVGV